LGDSRRFDFVEAYRPARIPDGLGRVRGRIGGRKSA
jgi:hypothetical protein